MVPMTREIAVAAVAAAREFYCGKCKARARGKRVCAACPILGLVGDATTSGCKSVGNAVPTLSSAALRHLRLISDA